MWLPSSRSAVRSPPPGASFLLTCPLTFTAGTAAVLNLRSRHSSRAEGGCNALLWGEQQPCTAASTCGGLCTFNHTRCRDEPHSWRLPERPQLVFPAGPHLVRQMIATLGGSGTRALQKLWGFPGLAQQAGQCVYAESGPCTAASVATLDASARHKRKDFRLSACTSGQLISLSKCTLPSAACLAAGPGGAASFLWRGGRRVVQFAPLH